MFFCQENSKKIVFTITVYILSFAILNKNVKTELGRYKNGR